ncbi:O-antigen ligase family protein [Rhizobacter fulvus]
MPEYLRAFVVILFLSGLTFVTVRKPVIALGMAAEDFARRRNVWLVVTGAAFLAHNFWVFTLVLIPVLLYARQRERQPFALYLFVLFAVPPFGSALSGLGIVNQLFELSFPRLLSLLVLLPWALSRRSADAPRIGKMLADWLLLGYVMLQLYQQWQVDTTTNTMRYGLYAFLDVLLPFYVASRSVRTTAARREALLSLVVAALLMAPIAAFEFSKHWLLYSSLPDALGMNWNGGSYLGRGQTLRAVVTTGHSISLGYVMMIAMLVHLALRRIVPQSRVWTFGMIGLLIGLIASVSRGPWVGALVGVIVFAASGPRPGTRLLKLAGAGIAVAVAVMISPWGSSLIDYLPFIGHVDSSNVDYRQRLFELSLLVISQNPLLGSPTFMFAAPLQELRNGNLIDIVNTYLMVALQSGYVGLALFVGVFAKAGFSIIAALRVQPDREAELFQQGRVLLSALAAIMVAIATLSPVGFVPLMYWCIVGLSVGYADAVRRQSPAVQVGLSRFATRSL